MTALPNAVALETVEDASEIIASEHRNNYSEIQAALNTLLGILDDGVAGQALFGVASDIAYDYAVRAAAGKFKQVAGSSVVTTDGSGNATINYGITFSAAPVVVVCNGDAAANPDLHVGLVEASRGVSSFVIDAALNSTQIRVNWIAYGTVA